MLNVEQSRAQYRIERSAFFPNVQGSAGFSRSRSSGSVTNTGQTLSGFTANEWTASVGVTSYEIDFFGRVRSLTAQALEKYFAQEEARRSAQITLVSQVATQYFTWCQDEEQVQLAQQTLTAVQASYDLTKSSFDAGAVTELDLRTAEAQVQTAKVNILTYQRQSAQALNNLVLLTGHPLPPALPERRLLSDHHVLASIPSGLPSSLLELRPDILQAEHTLKAANANIGAARAAFFPSVTLTGAAGTATADFSNLLGKNTSTWNFSPQVTVPIFNGGNLRASLDVAKISARIEVANYEKAIQTAFREVADALVARRIYAQQIEAQEALVTAEQKRYDIANTRYRQGADTYLNVLSAQQDLYNAQQSLLQTRFDNLSNQITLYKALGGGWK
jgi:multidrug efflux system outer membrane protein